MSLDKCEICDRRFNCFTDDTCCRVAVVYSQNESRTLLQIKIEPVDTYGEEQVVKANMKAGEQHFECLFSEVPATFFEGFLKGFIKEIESNRRPVYNTYHVKKLRKIYKEIQN